MRDRPGHGVTLSYYDFGQTPFFALQADQRVSYEIEADQRGKSSAVNLQNA